MKLTLTLKAALLLALVLAGCKPQDKTAKTADVVPAPERSSHFGAVNEHLELGGTLYGYVDIDGDILKVVPYLGVLAETIAREQPMAAPFLAQDFGAILTELGFNDVKAVGLSSVRSPHGGFRNRVYLHTPEGRRGLFAGFVGGEPAAFGGARLAPADADFYSESDVDAPALYAAVRALVARVAGEPMAGVLDIQLQQDASGLGVTPRAVIESLKGRVTLVLRTDPEKTFTLPAPQPVTLPEFEFLVRVDGLAAALAPALDQLPLFTVSQEGAVKFHVMTQPLPVGALQPVLGVEGTTLYIASTADFLRASLARTDGLAQTEGFRAALAELGEQGNGISYTSPRFFAQVQRLKELNPALLAAGGPAMDYLLGSLPRPSQPLVAVHVNLPDGVLYRARWHRSMKQDIAMVGVYNPVTAGLMAAMAIPAFQKVRATSQEKAIINNLRQLSAAADQHMLETGAAEARYAQIVGPAKYLRNLTPVAGEDYTQIVVRATDTEISVTTAAGRTVRIER